MHQLTVNLDGPTVGVRFEAERSRQWPAETVVSKHLPGFTVLFLAVGEDSGILSQEERAFCALSYRKCADTLSICSGGSDTLIFNIKQEGQLEGGGDFSSRCRDSYESSCSTKHKRGTSVEKIYEDKAVSWKSCCW